MGRLKDFLITYLYNGPLLLTDMQARGPVPGWEQPGHMAECAADLLE
jgi:hypothetical protein